MKFLKTYKKFETIGYTELTDEMWKDISDILLDLHDSGFFISKDINDVKKIGNKLCDDVIEIVIDKDDKSHFKFSDIEEEIRRLIDYMSQFKWNYSLAYFGKFQFVEFECGGEDPLNKIFDPKLKTDAEKILFNSFNKKILDDCPAIKISFFQSIDHIIKESISDQDLVLDTKDIFLDLRDQGFEVDIDMRPQGVDKFSVGISNDKLFDWKDVKDELLRAKQMILDNHFSLQKVIVTYYPLGAFNDSGVRVLNRMRTEKFVGSVFSAFVHYVGHELQVKGGKIYEIAFIFSTNNK